MSKHVAVLMGGWSAEREISLRSGKACADVLEKQDYRLTRIDVGRDIATVLQTLTVRTSAGAQVVTRPVSVYRGRGASWALDVTSRLRQVSPHFTAGEGCLVARRRSSARLDG